jgi:hypothetical protein
MPVSAKPHDQASEMRAGPGLEGNEMKHVKTAFLGAILLAGTALAVSSPAKAQVQIQGYVGTDPYYGTDPNYVDPNYDPNYAQNYQDPAYDHQ